MLAGILAVVALLAAGGMWYFSRSAADVISDSLKNQISFGETLASLNKTTNMLRSELASSTRAELAFFQEVRTLKSICRTDTFCNERYRGALTGAILGKNNMAVQKEEYTATGLNFFKYFSEPPHVPSQGPSPYDNGVGIFPMETFQFIKTNCPADIGTPGLLLSKYRYRIGDKKIAEFLYNDEAMQVICAWAENETAKTFTKLQ